MLKGTSRIIIIARVLIIARILHIPELLPHLAGGPDDRDKKIRKKPVQQV
jgi:hypothetical protein